MWWGWCWYLTLPVRARLQEGHKHNQRLVMQSGAIGMGIGTSINHGQGLPAQASSSIKRNMFTTSIMKFK